VLVALLERAEPLGLVVPAELPVPVEQAEPEVLAERVGRPVGPVPDSAFSTDHRCSRTSSCALHPSEVI